jgi:hypothetical protein
MQLLMVDGNGILHPRGLLYSFGIAISLLDFLPVGAQLLCFCRLCFISYKKCFKCDSFWSSSFIVKPSIVMENDAQIIIM